MNIRSGVHYDHQQTEVFAMLRLIPLTALALLATQTLAAPPAEVITGQYVCAGFGVAGTETVTINGTVLGSEIKCGGVRAARCLTDGDEPDQRRAAINAIEGCSTSGPGQSAQTFDLFFNFVCSGPRTQVVATINDICTALFAAPVSGL